MCTDNPANGKAVSRELWAREANEQVRYGRGFHWVESPLVMGYIQEQITGNPELDWLTYSYHKYVYAHDRTTRILSLGCGGGALERDLCRLGFTGNIDACDFSEGAVEHARRMAAQQGLKNIHYFVSDLNQADFSSRQYEIIFSGSALHHISNLEHLLDQLRAALVERGVLIVNEYVGPFQLQWTPRQTRIINDLLGLLPSIYRKRISAPGETKESFLGPSTVRDMNANDPSEAIRSNEIVPLIEARFAVREHKNFGGTILHMLLQDIAGNFDPTNCTDAAFLNLLIYIERLLIREEVLSSDFAFIVAEKNDESARLRKDYRLDLTSELRARGLRIESMQERLRQSEEHVSYLMGEVGRRDQHIRNLEEERGRESGSIEAGRIPSALRQFRQWKELNLPIGSRKRRVYDAFAVQVRRWLVPR